MPKSTRPRSANACLQWIHEKQIDWLEEDPTNRHRAPKGVMSSPVLERLLLARPMIVLKSGDGRYMAISEVPAVLRLASTDPGDDSLVPCLVVEDGEWDLATWAALIRWVAPWVDGNLTGREKRRIRKMLKAHPALAAAISARPARERAKDVTQEPPQPSTVSAASASGDVKSPKAQGRQEYEHASNPTGLEPPPQGAGAAEHVAARLVNRDGNQQKAE